jgi:hypothetical protein
MAFLRLAVHIFNWAVNLTFSSFVPLCTNDLDVLSMAEQLVLPIQSLRLLVLNRKVKPYSFWSYTKPHLNTDKRGRKPLQIQIRGNETLFLSQHKTKSSPRDDLIGYLRLSCLFELRVSFQADLFIHISLSQ